MEDHLVVDIAGGTVVTPQDSAKVGLVKALIISSRNAPQDIARRVAIKDTMLGIWPARIIINDYMIQKKLTKQVEKNYLQF